MAEPGSETEFPVVDLPPQVDSPEAAVRFLVAELVRAGSLPAQTAAEVTRQVWQRERLGSTAIGRGVAISHAQVRAVTGPVGVVGRRCRPLDWPGAVDGNSVGLVCLVVVQSGSAAYLFRELERLARQLRGG